MATGGEEAVGYSLDKVGTVTLQNADKDPRYTSIVVCQDKMVVLDRINNKVQIHGLHDGKFMPLSVSLESRPWDMCLMDAMTVCVLHEYGLIKIMSIESTDRSRDIKTSRTFRLQGVLMNSYRGVARFKDSLVVAGVRRGTIYWCIVSMDDGRVDTIHQICKGDGWCRVTTKDTIIYISCHADYKSPDTGVYAFDILNPSQCKYKYKHPRLQSPTSIVVNKDRNIFVCNNGFPVCIHQLTASCQPVAIFTQEIPWDLCALFWDNGLLYGICCASPVITVFRHVYRGSRKASEVLVSYERKHSVSEEKAIQIGQGNVKEMAVKIWERNAPIPFPEESEDKQDPVFYDEGKKKMEMEDGKKKEIQGQSHVEITLPPSIQLLKDFKDDKQDHNPGKEISLIEGIKENDLRKIGLLFKNRRVPSKNTIINAINKHGYSQGIRCLLGGLSNILRKEIPHATQVWCGYRTQDPHTPVFVVMYSKDTSIQEKMKVSTFYDDYDIVFRKEHTPNDEEENISGLLEANPDTIDKEDIDRVQDLIARKTERLMKEHSNLSIIAASTVKASGFNGSLSKLKLRQSLCIVLYVPVKGIIPIGEKEFPKNIDGISIDVREGEFVFHGRKKAHKWHPNLRMGCRISTKDEQYGTLGGFVDLPGGKTGCITAAHVVLNEKERKGYVKFKKAKKARYNASLAKGHSVIEIYQPTWRSAAFGRVFQIAFEEGNKSTPSVDAAVVEITDDNRTPNTGMFPSGNYPYLGFTEEKPMMYSSGNTRDHLNISRGCRVVKYGCSTNITHGKLEWNGASVRILNTVGKSWNRLKADNISYPKFFNQMVVKSSNKSNFSVPGDSGALVFLYRTSNSDLEAIGLLIGGSTHRLSGRMHIVTPIQAVFQELELDNMFKHFPNINHGEQTLTMNEVIYSRQQSNIHLELSDKTKLKEEIKEAVKSEIREEIKEIQEAVKANTASLEQIKEEMKDRTSLLEQKIDRLLLKLGGDADQS